MSGAAAEIEARAESASQRAQLQPTCSHANARRFAVQLLCTALATVLGSAFFNVLVDPYGLVRWVDLSWLNEIKPRATQAVKAFKYRAVDFGKPKTLILGNSRAEMGWDPDSLLGERFGVVVNAAIPGSDMRAMEQLADHAWVRSKPTTLIVGAEFFDCIEGADAPPRPTGGMSPWSAVDPSRMHSLALARNIIGESLSLDTTLDSLQTLAAQWNSHAPHLRRDGFQPARSYPNVQKIDGARKMFLQRDQANAVARMNGPKGIRYGNGQLSICFDSIDRLLASAHVRDQTVYLATHPYHARLLETIVNASLWPAYEEWKATLSTIVAAHKEKGLRVSLWDFGSYHTYAIEPIPRPGERKPIPQWYWESGHFRAELGSRMLGSMTGTRAADGLFGAELSPRTLHQHLEVVRVSRSAFAAMQPETVAEMANMAARVGRRLDRAALPAAE